MVKFTSLSLPFLFALSACDFINSAASKQAQEMAKAAACPHIQSKALAEAKKIYETDHPKILPVLSSETSAFEDEAMFDKAIAELGFITAEKPWAGRDHFTTTVPLELAGVEGVLALVQGFESKPQRIQAATKGHELLHAIAWVRMGRAEVAKSYPLPSIKLALELTAYHFSEQALRKYGRREGLLIRADRRETAKNLHEGYVLYPAMTLECVEDTLEKVYALGYSMSQSSSSTGSSGSGSASVEASGGVGGVGVEAGENTLTMNSFQSLGYWPWRSASMPRTAAFQTSLPLSAESRNRLDSSEVIGTVLNVGRCTVSAYSGSVLASTGPSFCVTTEGS